MSRKDVMVDIETLGTGEDSSIFQIVACEFDITTGKTYTGFQSIGDIEQYDSLKVDGSTLKWWLNTDKELLTELLNRGSLSESQMITLFYDWLVKLDGYNMGNVYLWGNGILFDNAKLQYALNKHSMGYPIAYKNDRDVRTIVELASMKSGLSEQILKDNVTHTNERKHDAYDDVMFQIRLVHYCHELLMGGNVKL